MRSRKPACRHRDELNPYVRPIELPAPLWTYLDAHCVVYGVTIHTIFREAVEIMRLADKLALANSAFNEATATVQHLVDEARTGDEKPRLVH